MPKHIQLCFESDARAKLCQKVTLSLRQRLGPDTHFRLQPSFPPNQCSPDLAKISFTNRIKNV